MTSIIAETERFYKNELIIAYIIVKAIIRTSFWHLNDVYIDLFSGIGHYLRKKQKFIVNGLINKWKQKRLVEKIAIGCNKLYKYMKLYIDGHPNYF